MNPHGRCAFIRAERIAMGLKPARARARSELGWSSCIPRPSVAGAFSRVFPPARPKRSLPLSSEPGWRLAGSWPCHSGPSHSGRCDHRRGCCVLGEREALTSRHSRSFVRRRFFLSAVSRDCQCITSAMQRRPRLCRCAVAGVPAHCPAGHFRSRACAAICAGLSGRLPSKSTADPDSWRVGSARTGRRRARAPRSLSLSLSLSPSPICPGMGDGGWGSHPRFAGDGRSIPSPIPDLPGIGDHPHPHPRFQVAGTVIKL